jgi:hypothetical protein
VNNLILKQGDLVKVLTSGGFLNVLGFSRGDVALVTPLGDGRLGLNTARGPVTLVNSDGTLADVCGDVALHRCPVTLPRGNGNA